MWGTQNLPYNVSKQDQNDIFPEHMGIYQTEYNFDAISRKNVAVVTGTIDIFEKNVIILEQTNWFFSWKEYTVHLLFLVLSKVPKIGK